jgi:histidine triad (HIT) family protein
MAVKVNDCIFCRIIKKEIKSDIIYEDDSVLAFKDLNPMAPVHILVVPKKHIGSLTEIGKLSDSEISRILKVISKISLDLELDPDGFRVVTNTGISAGQSVGHLHFHLLGGRVFGWPPG